MKWKRIEPGQYRSGEYWAYRYKCADRGCALDTSTHGFVYGLKSLAASKRVAEAIEREKKWVK